MFNLSMKRQVMILLAVILIGTIVMIGYRFFSSKPSSIETSSELPSITLKVGVVGARDNAVEVQSEINQLIRQSMKADYITIETVPFPSIAPGSIDEILTDLMSDDGPDVLLLSLRRHATLLADYGALLPLDGLTTGRFDVSVNLDLLHQSGLKNATWKNTLLGMPMTLDPIVIAYNEGHYSEANVQPDPDWYWSGYTDVSKRILHERALIAAERPEWHEDPSLLDIPRHYYEMNQAGATCGDPTCWLPFLLSHGGGYISDDLERVEIDLDESIEAFAWLQEQLRSQALVNQNSTHFSLLYEGISFAPTYFSQLIQLNEESNRFAVMPFPKSPATGESRTLVTGSMYVINAHSTKIDTAVDFVVASLSHPAQEYAAYVAGHLPSRKDVPPPPLYGVPSQEVIQRILDTATPFLPAFIGNRHVWEPTLPIWPELVDGSLTAEQFVATLRGELLDILDQRDDPFVPSPPSPSEGFFGASPPRPPDPVQKPPPTDFLQSGGIEIRWLVQDMSMLPLVEAFNEQHEDVYVHLVTPNRNEFIFDAIRSGLAQGDLDIISGPSTTLFELREEGLLRPLDRVIQEMNGNAYDHGIFDQVRYHGVLYRIPLTRAPIFLVADQTIWERVGQAYPENGWTWKDFLHWVKKATDPTTDNFGFSMSDSDWFIPFHQAGGTLLDGPYDVLADILPLFKELSQLAPQVSGGPMRIANLSDVLHQQAASVMTYLINIQLHLLGSGETDANQPEDVAAAMQRAGLMVLPLPSLKADVGSAVGSELWSVAVPTTASRPDVAMRFITWALSLEGSRRIASGERASIPVALYPDVLELIKDRLGPQFAQTLALPFILNHQDDPGYFDLRTKAMEVTGAYFSGQLSDSEVIEILREELFQILQEDS